MPATPEYGLRYPSLADAPNGPDAVQDLAEDVESTLSTLAPISASTVNAKGDLLAGTANDAISRLAVGADGEVLIADSGAPTGLAWTQLVTVAAGTAYITTYETTTSVEYVDLATIGPAVTITVGPSGVALVLIKADVRHALDGEVGTGTGMGSMSFAVSGANTAAASTSSAANSEVDVFLSGTDTFTLDTNISVSSHTLLTGLTPGSTTFTMKYGQSLTDPNDVEWGRRRLTVVTF